MKVCKKAHVSESFGEVPVGSLWDDDSEVVAENPKNFKSEATAADDDDTEVE